LTQRVLFWAGNAVAAIALVEGGARAVPAPSAN
jgi:hypothetical protein